MSAASYTTSRDLTDLVGITNPYPSQIERWLREPSGALLHPRGASLVTGAPRSCVELVDSCPAVTRRANRHPFHIRGGPSNVRDVDRGLMVGVEH